MAKLVKCLDVPEGHLIADEKTTLEQDIKTVCTDIVNRIDEVAGDIRGVSRVRIVIDLQPYRVLGWKLEKEYYSDARNTQL